MIAFTVGIALLIHITVRDRVPGAAALFYATPYPVLLAASIVGAILGWRSRGQLLTFGILTALFAMLTVQTAWAPGPASEPPPGRDRIVFWNCAGLPFGVEAAARRIKEWEADLIVLTEAAPRKRSVLDRWKQNFPDRTLEPVGSGMLWISRSPIRLFETGSLGHRGSYAVGEVNFPDGKLLVMQVDLSSNPLLSRRRAFTALQKLQEKYAGRDLVMLGDFNTPLDSWFFDSISRKMHHTFAEAGSGWEPTWPVPLPVLTLDHIWLSPDLMPRGAVAHATRVSDHRALEVSFERGKPAK